MASFSINAPFCELLGMEIVEWRDGYAKLASQLQPQFLNRHGIPHGGYIASLLDSAIGFSGLYCPYEGRHRLALTLSLTTNFVGKAQTNELYVVSKVVKSGFKVFFAEASVYDSGDNLIATAQGVMRYNKGSETSKGVPEGQITAP